MSHSSLDRVQQDLKLIQSVLPSDFPYDRGSVALNAAAALCGIPLALRAVPGWDRPMMGVLLAMFAGLMVACGVWLRRARAERAERPRRWAWGRQELASSSIAITGAVAYAALVRWSSAAEDRWNFTAWRDRLAGPALVAVGIGAVVFSVGRSERRSSLGWAAALTGAGLAMPWVPSRPAVWVVCGAAIFFGGLTSAALLWRDFRNREDAHAGN